MLESSWDLLLRGAVVVHLRGTILVFAAHVYELGVVANDARSVRVLREKLVVESFGVLDDVRTTISLEGKVVVKRLLLLEPNSSLYIDDSVINVTRINEIVCKSHLL